MLSQHLPRFFFMSMVVTANFPIMSNSVRDAFSCFFSSLNWLLAVNAYETIYRKSPFKVFLVFIGFVLKINSNFMPLSQHLCPSNLRRNSRKSLRLVIIFPEMLLIILVVYSFRNVPVFAPFTDYIGSRELHEQQ